MDTSRFKRSTVEVPCLAVFLERPHGEHLHTGIVYKDIAGRFRRLHLGWYKKLIFEECPPALGCAVPKFDPTDEQFVALYCAKIARSFPSQKMPYNLKIDNEVRFNTDGDIEAGPSYTGLSCATFVVAVFRSAGNPLIDTEKWPEATEEDRAMQQRFVAVMRSSGPEEQAHADIIEPEIGGPRVAPEEIAGACLEEIYPVAHAECEAAGRFLIAAIDGPHPQPPTPHSRTV